MTVVVVSLGEAWSYKRCNVSRVKLREGLTTTLSWRQAKLRG